MGQVPPQEKPRASRKRKPKYIHFRLVQRLRLRRLLISDVLLTALTFSIFGAQTLLMGSWGEETMVVEE